jgi:hypothetical protein
MMFSHIQSPHDIPARVEGGPAGLCRMPSLQVGKWNDEAYLQIRHPGEKVREVSQNRDSVVLSTGDRRHVMRRLGECEFEYDVILNHRPSKPLVTLPLEFPRGLSFFKQRPTGRDDLVSGSYAVYWRGRNNRYRTGKLCHIYRPKIIDADGRWIWGEQDFDGENLLISIDEVWLKSARYPVTVDPIIGTSTVGSKHQDESDPNPEEWYDLCYEMVMPVNRYTAPTGMLGSCTAYVYAYKSDSDAQGYPVLYGESGSAPSAKLSSFEGLLDMRSPGGGSWISAGFDVASPITAGTPLWFGVMPYYMLYPYYDDGGDIAVMDTSALSSPPAIFVPGGWTPTARTLSMYFDYTEHTSHAVELGSGVGVGDSLVSPRELRRESVDSVGVSDGAERQCGWKRIQEDDGGVGEEIDRRVSWRRGAADDAGVQDGLIRRAGRFLRLSDSPLLWDWTSGRRMLGLVVRKLVSRITRALNLESRIGDGEE